MSISVIRTLNLSNLIRNITYKKLIKTRIINKCDVYLTKMWQSLTQGGRGYILSVRVAQLIIAYKKLATIIRLF